MAAELAARHATSKPKRAFHGEVVEGALDAHKLLLLCPHTLMNLSGGSVLEARDFYKIPPEDLLVVSDDLNLPLAKLRFRKSGSSGGQRGLEDVIHRLGSEDIPRLRIGIGNPPASRDAAGYVLGGALVGVAGLVATTHICLPSILFRTACGQMPSYLPRRA